MSFALLAAFAVVSESAAGELHGKIALEIPDQPLPRRHQTVVFLEALSAALPSAPRRTGLRIQQRDARFEPPFLAVAAGESIAMPNDDVIFHNVFSFSVPNDFDLGLYPQGESRSVTFRYPGVVRMYCSIHESMSATVFVAPSHLFARVDPDGTFAIRSVPAGRYRVRAWSNRLPGADAEVDVPEADRVEVTLTLGARGAPR